MDKWNKIFVKEIKNASKELPKLSGAKFYDKPFKKYQELSTSSSFSLLALDSLIINDEILAQEAQTIISQFARQIKWCGVKQISPLRVEPQHDEQTATWKVSLKIAQV